MLIGMNLRSCEFVGWLVFSGQILVSMGFPHSLILFVCFFSGLSGGCTKTRKRQISWCRDVVSGSFVKGF